MAIVFTAAFNRSDNSLNIIILSLIHINKRLNTIFLKTVNISLYFIINA